MSYIRDDQLEACEKRLRDLQGRGLYTGADDLDVPILWQHSYRHLEHPGEPSMHTVSTIALEVLHDLPGELALLSFAEEKVLRNLVQASGYYHLTEFEEIDAAESLIRRLWCSILFPPPEVDSEIPVLILPSEIMMMVMQAYMRDGVKETRARVLMALSQITAMLYLFGVFPADRAQSLVAEAVKDTFSDNEELIRRCIRVSFEYVVLDNGEEMLIHPALVNPMKLAETRTFVPAVREVSPVRLQQAFSGVLGEERRAVMLLRGAITGIVRQENDLQSIIEDLLFMAKQDATEADMRAVLAAALIVKPTADCDNAIHRLWLETQRWPMAYHGKVH